MLPLLLSVTAALAESRSVRVRLSPVASGWPEVQQSTACQSDPLMAVFRLDTASVSQAAVLISCLVVWKVRSILISGKLIVWVFFFFFHFSFFAIWQGGLQKYWRSIRSFPGLCDVPQGERKPVFLPPPALD